LNDEESILFKTKNNVFYIHKLTDYIGGEVILTNYRLLFIPTYLDALKNKFPSEEYFKIPLTFITE